ncbi:MAG: glycosyltransferase [Chloroflexota bacterium]|nr:glycosyltransferase [Chloroflexota bacterium]
MEPAPDSPSAPGSVQQEFRKIQRQRDELRLALDVEIKAHLSDRTTARESLGCAQDLSAQLFRTRNELKAARMTAEELTGRVADLDRQVRELGESPQALLWQPGASTGGSAHDGSRAPVPGKHVHPPQSMLEQLQQAQAQEKSRWKAELGEARNTARQAVRMLDELLGSRSWLLTHPLRSFIERMRGRRWSEPQVPSITWESRQGPVTSGEIDADSWGCIAGLSFPVFASPRISIIIPAYGNLGVTARCLRSIRAHLPAVPHEVILVEDQSGDPDIEVLAEVPGLVYRENVRNLGFLHSCNAAVDLARGEFVCFLNNDTEVTAGWLDELLHIYERFPDCGMVGAKLIFPDGTLQEAGGIIWADGSGWNFGRNGNPSAPEFNYVREVDYCSGAVLMLRRDLFNEVGRFDDRYAPAYYEDADLAFRIRERGLKVYYCPLAEVKHIEGASHGTSTSSGIKAFQTRNKKIFRERWRHVLDRRHYRNGECGFRARDHARHKPVVLVMDHTLPQPDRDAGSRAMLQTMIRLTRMGMVVKFWPNDRLYGPRYRHLLEDAGIEVVIEQEWEKGFENYVREVGQELDFALLSRPNFAPPYVATLREYSRARIALYGHDIHYRRLLAQAEVTGDEQARAGAIEFQQMEQSLWREVDSIIYPSQEDADVVADYVGMDKVHAVPLYSFEEAELTMPEDADPTKLLFVAGFGHPPNEDAAEWLAGTILPLIRRHLPEVVLHLVGSKPTARVRGLAGAQVKIFANVSTEELERHYRTATVAIAPLRFGGGVKLKVVEAMARGVPMVTTSVGAQGLPGVEECIGVSDKADELARIVIGLFQDRARAREAALASHAYLREHYSEACMERSLWRALAGTEEIPV